MDEEEGVRGDAVTDNDRCGGGGGAGGDVEDGEVGEVMEGVNERGRAMESLKSEV
jgi:hypothetical protein